MTCTSPPPEKLRQSCRCSPMMISSAPARSSAIRPPSPSELANTTGWRPSSPEHRKYVPPANSPAIAVSGAPEASLRSSPDRFRLMSKPKDDRRSPSISGLSWIRLSRWPLGVMAWTVASAAGSPGDGDPGTHPKSRRPLGALRSTVVPVRVPVCRRPAWAMGPRACSACGWSPGGPRWGRPAAGPCRPAPGGRRVPRPGQTPRAARNRHGRPPGPTVCSGPAGGCRGGAGGRVRAAGPGPRCRRAGG